VLKPHGDLEILKIQYFAEAGVQEQQYQNPGNDLVYQFFFHGLFDEVEKKADFIWVSKT